MSIEEWFYSLPNFTKYYLISSVGITVATSLGTVNPYSLFWEFSHVVKTFEIWRAVTNFLFFGKFGFPFFINMVMLVQFAKGLETHNSFANNYADFIWCMIVLILQCLVYGSFVTVGFMSTSLVFAMIYVWSKKESELEVRLMFGFRCKAWQLPFVLIVIRLLMGGQIIDDLIGLVAGHMYYFLKEIVPNDYGYNFIKTPKFLENYFPVARANRPAQGAIFGGRGHRLG